jgi:outer membrane protein, heavy metal efflux system
MHVARLPVVTFLLISGVLASERLPTPLAGLIAEAQNNNPEIRAAERGWKAATHVARQVTTLPDPQFTVQQFSVGSPKPFAGFSNSDFAYIGFGASQTLPYPGKLRLKGQVAARGADARRAQADELRSSLAQQVKKGYFNRRYLFSNAAAPRSIS